MTTAQAIRKELKTNFPETKFNVTTKDGNVRVRRIDGADHDSVDDIVKKYEYSVSRTAELYYDVDTQTNIIKDIQQVEYVNTFRKKTA